MSPESRRLAGILLIVYPTIIFGGVSLLYLLIVPESGYADNEGKRKISPASAGIMSRQNLYCRRPIQSFLRLSLICLTK